MRPGHQSANANRPKGAISGEGRRLQIYTQTPARRASDYASMVVAWRNGSAVRLSDVAEVVDGVENTRTLGLFNGQPAIIGHLGTTQLAGLGVASAALITAANVFVFPAYGTTSIVARQVGAGSAATLACLQPVAWAQ